MLFSNWKIESLVASEQPSGVLEAKQNHKGVIVLADTLINKEVEADGIFLKDKDLTVGIRTADCMPLFIMSEKAVLALHVSRKTLVEGILDEVESFLETEKITGIYIGPHICQRHFVFEYLGDELKMFLDKFPDSVEKKGVKIYLSLRSAVQKYFDDWGISEKLISESGVCTYEDDKLPSYKREVEAGGNLKNHLHTLVKYCK